MPTGAENSMSWATGNAAGTPINQRRGLKQHDCTHTHTSLQEGMLCHMLPYRAQGTALCLLRCFIGVPAAYPFASVCLCFCWKSLDPCMHMCNGTIMMDALPLATTLVCANTQHQSVKAVAASGLITHRAAASCTECTSCSSSNSSNRMQQHAAAAATACSSMQQHAAAATACTSCTCLAPSAVHHALRSHKLCLRKVAPMHLKRRCKLCMLQGRTNCAR